VPVLDSLKNKLNGFAMFVKNFASADRMCEMDYESFQERLRALAILEQEYKNRRALAEAETAEIVRDRTRECVKQARELEADENAAERLMKLS
jgi:hypothetical protein